MNIQRIATDYFEFAHGRKPSGSGSWAFEFITDAGRSTEFAPGTMLYSQAKRWARGRAKELKAYRVAVCS